MQKFYEYNELNEKEIIYGDGEGGTERAGPSGWAIPVGVGVVGTGAFLTYKAAKKIFSFIPETFGIALGKGLRGTLVNEKKMSEDALTLAQKLKETIITPKGKMAAKSLNIFFESEGLYGSKIYRALRKNAIKIVLMSESTEQAIKELKLLEVKGKKLPERILEKFSKNKGSFGGNIKSFGYTKSSKLNRSIIGRAFSKAGAKTATGANVISNIIKTSKAGKYIANTSIWKNAARFAGTTGKVLGKMLPGIGWALAAYDAYSAVSYLIGDSDLYEPEEGWRNAKHSTTIKEDADKSYDIIANGIKASVFKIGGSVEKFIKDELDNSLLIKMPSNDELITEEGEPSELLMQYTNFLIDLDNALAVSNFGKVFNKIKESAEYLKSEIKDEYNGINISGLSDNDDWDLIKKAAQKYNLESDDNVYGEKVAEETGNIIDYFFVPGFKAMGWATVFTSEDYLSSIKSNFDSTSILGLMQKTYSASGMYGSNLNNFNLSSFRNIIKAVLGDDFYDEHKNILLSFIFGQLDENDNFKKMGGMEKYIDLMKGRMIQALEEHLKGEDGGKMLLSTPILSLGVTYGVIVMLINIFNSTYINFKKLQENAIIAEAFDITLDEVIDETHQEAIEDSKQIVKEIEQKEAEQKETETDSKEKVETEEETEIENNKKDGPNILTKMQSFEEYL